MGQTRRMKMLFIDAKKAHLNGVVSPDEHVYVELPPEAHVPGASGVSHTASSGKRGRLRRWLYGMRAAGNAWEKDYVAKFESIGFARGVSAPTVFFNSALNLRCVVHGDDFLFLGYD